MRWELSKKFTLLIPAQWIRLSQIMLWHRHIKNRPHQLDYKTAIENDLPIGSGEIESAHRYVIQKRLKIAGAWWLEKNADKMLSLRVNRENKQWDGYWKRAV